MRYRYKLGSKLSKKRFRKSAYPLKKNRTRLGLKRGGTRL